MSNAFAPIVRARPSPIFGRPVHQGSPPFDYSPILLLKPFGFRITPDTLSSIGLRRWPARHYPRLWIQHPSSECRRDFNPPDSCAAQRTLRSPAKRIAGLHRALLITGHDPLLALRGGAVGEGIRHHPPGRLPLQRIVADGGCRRQRRVDVAG